MRMWMVDPRIMCQKHLLGEHVETHMFFACILKNKNLSGYINNNLFEAQSLFYRHFILSQEMQDRGYKHKSIMNLGKYITYHKNYKNVKIDINKSLNDLVTRCPECRKRMEELNG